MPEEEIRSALSLSKPVAQATLAPIEPEQDTDQLPMEVE